MKNKGYLIALFSFLIAMSGMIFISSNKVTASPRSAVHAMKTSRNEGNKRIALSVSVSSTTWTQVLPIGLDRRAAILQTLSGSAGTVCLSTHSVSGISCNDNAEAVMLEAGTSYSDYSEQPLYGRAFDASGAVVVHGAYYYDSRDAGLE